MNGGREWERWDYRMRERSVLVVVEDTQEAVSWCRVTLAQKWKLYTFIMGFECRKKHTTKKSKNI